MDVGCTLFVLEVCLLMCHGIGNSGASLEHAGASARWLGSM